MNHKGSNKIIYQDNSIIKFLIESKKYGNKECIIDVKDWDKIKKLHWHYHYIPKKNICYVRSGKYNIHRIILNITNPKIFVDHINHNGLDNRKSNLRKCTNTENCRNAKLKKNNTSGYKGVYWSKDVNKWKVQLNFNNSKIYGGRYDKIEHAALSYNKLALQYYKKFANLNEV